MSDTGTQINATSDETTTPAVGFTFKQIVPQIIGCSVRSSSKEALISPYDKQTGKQNYAISSPQDTNPKATSFRNIINSNLVYLDIHLTC